MLAVRLRLSAVCSSSNVRWHKPCVQMIERTRQGSVRSGGDARGLQSLGLPPVCSQFSKGLILAQNERWRRGLGMQVEREPVFGLGTAANGVGSPR